jgi:hypothetical protein
MSSAELYREQSDLSEGEVTSMGISRRNFLLRVGQVGSYSAAFATMQSLGEVFLRRER